MNFRLRTRNSATHIVAVRERRLLEFSEACVIAGMTRIEMKRAIGPDGAPFVKVGRRYYIRPAILRTFLESRRASTRA